MQFTKNLVKTWFNRRGYTLVKTGGRQFPYVSEVIYEDEGPAFKFWIRDLGAEYSYTCSWKNHPEYYAIKRLVADRQIRHIVEVGAHHGIYTLPMSQMVGPEGCIIAYEPSPANAMALHANLSLNGITNVEVVMKALGASAGKVDFNRNGSAVISRKETRLSEVDQIVVPVVALDDQIEGPIDLLKIDVEGFEGEVLKGCSRLLESRPCLVLEIHNPFLPAFDSSFDQIARMAHLDEYEGFVYDNQSIDLQHLRKWEGVASTPQDIIVHLFLYPRSCR